MTEITPNDKALFQVDWLLEQAYKRAVKLRGVNDWTNDFKSIEEKQKAEREVEQYQLKIAEMIYKSIRDIELDKQHSEFRKEMDDERKDFNSRMKDYYDKDDDQKGYSSYDKDDFDDRGTDEIGKV